MLNQEEKTEIYTLLKAGFPVSAISRKTGRSAMTIYRLQEAGEEKVKIKAKNATSFTQLQQYKYYLNKQLNSGVINCNKLFNEIKKQGYKGSYTTVSRYAKNRKQELQVDRRGSHRFETNPGEQAQVDWGHFGKIEVNGRVERLYFFLYTLGYSRAAYLEFTVRQNLQTLLNCHINSFQKLGIPETILYDNMKVVTPYREKLPNQERRPYYNPAFLDFANYYGFRIGLCHPYWPRTKGKVESGVKYVKKSLLQGMQLNKHFSSLEDLNNQARNWLEKVANTRIHRTTGEKPRDRWKKEKMYLKFPNYLPTYQISSFITKKGTKDGLIQHKSNFYSIPIQYARKHVYVQEENKNGIATLEIYYQDRKIATHNLSHERGKWIVEEKHLQNENKPKISNKKTKNQEKTKKENLLLEDFSRPLSYYEQIMPENT